LGVIARMSREYANKRKCSQPININNILLYTTEMDCRFGMRPPTIERNQVVEHKQMTEEKSNSINDREEYI
jgi:hypothetical protein